MPVFDFKCEKCGHVQEKVVGLKEEEIKCEKCESTKLKKLLSGSFAFRMHI